VTQRTLLVLVLCALLACASQPPAATTPFEAAHAREAEPLAEIALAAEGGGLRARAPARLLAPITWESERFLLQLDAGSEAPVVCSVFPDGLDAAASLAAFSKEIFAPLEQDGSLKQRQILAVDAGHFAGRPFLALDWVYRIERGGNPLAGQVKLLVAQVGEGALYCAHDEVGYVQSFRRVAGALAGTLELERASRPSYLSQVSIFSLRDLRVGYELVTLEHDAEGDTRIDTRTSLLLPVDGQTLQQNDSYDVAFSRPDGSVINQHSVEAVNGEVMTQLRLDPAEDGGWSVTGKFQGKPLSAEIPQGAPASWLGEGLALREALARDGARAVVAVETWSADLDPTRLFEARLGVQRQLDADRFAAKLSVADVEADLVVDRDGLPVSGVVPAGPTDVKIERVFLDGSL
jgi:hypothetical protein